MTFVLDSSVAIAWAMPDERDAPAEALLARVFQSGANVPNLWPLEIAHVLLKLERGRGLPHRSEAAR